jgi:hypothetical protein
MTITPNVDGSPVAPRLWDALERPALRESLTQWHRVTPKQKRM